MSATQTQTAAPASDPKPFGTLLTAALRDVQSGLPALQTAEGQELAAESRSPRRKRP